MENNIPSVEHDGSSFQRTKEDVLLPASIIVAAALIAGAWIYTGGLEQRRERVLPQEQGSLNALEEAVAPSEGVVLPVVWKDMGVQMVRAGVIDKEKFEKLYEGRGGVGEYEKNLLQGTENGNIKITPENSGILLNLFWALGLGTKNDILEKGPMRDLRYGGAGGFASTGGWTLSEGNAMDHYARHPFIVLTNEKQSVVERVSKNIFRPCCDNSTYFPDCNHGMAMLGLLELMASQGVSEEEMYRVALQVNAYWFPDTYLTIGTYMKNNGIDWKDVDPQEILGINYSSVSGYARIAAQVAEPQQERGENGCGVDAGGSAAPERESVSPTLQRGEQSGCGI